MPDSGIRYNKTVDLGHGDEATITVHDVHPGIDDSSIPAHTSITFPNDYSEWASETNSVTLNADELDDFITALVAARRRLSDIIRPQLDKKHHKRHAIR